jgi:hypothetical protein
VRHARSLDKEEEERDKHKRHQIPTQHHQKEPLPKGAFNNDHKRMDVDKMQADNIKFSSPNENITTSSNIPVHHRVGEPSQVEQKRSAASVRA